MNKGLHETHLTAAVAAHRHLLARVASAHGTPFPLVLLGIAISANSRERLISTLIGLYSRHMALPPNHTARCGTCLRELNNVKDPRSVDCGGHCLQCIADAGDPDCVEEIRKIEAYPQIAVLDFVRLMKDFSCRPNRVREDLVVEVAHELIERKERTRPASR